MTLKTSIFIPARMSSTRFPGKPLAPIEGIPMVIYCANNAIKTGLEVFVCTDSKEIEAICNLYKIQCILTPECETGTDRISFAVNNVDCDYIINLQGDEPLLNNTSLQKMISMIPCLETRQDAIISGVSAIHSEEAFDPNNVKCSLIKNNSIIQYFSRKPLLNNLDKKKGAAYFKQIGLYAMSKKVLKKFSSLPKGNLEEAERVELLRWIENGFNVRACLIDSNTISVDTPEDLVEVISSLGKK